MGRKKSGRSAPGLFRVPGERKRRRRRGRRGGRSSRGRRKRLARRRWLVAGLNSPRESETKRGRAQVDIRAREQTRHLPTIRKTFTSSVPGNAQPLPPSLPLPYSPPPPLPLSIPFSTHSPGDMAVATAPPTRCNARKRTGERERERDSILFYRVFSYPRERERTFSVSFFMRRALETRKWRNETCYFR